MKIRSVSLRGAWLGLVVGVSWLIACSTGSISSPEPAVEAGAALDSSGRVPSDSDATGIDSDAPSRTADAAADAGDATDAGAAPIVIVSVGGHVEAGGPVAGATVRVLSPPMVTTTDADGNFFFYLPLGAAIVMKVEAPDDKHLAMIRGLVVGTNRPRTFYLTGPDELGALKSLGFTLDPDKALVEVDFRNSKQGGYSVTMMSGGTALTPGFGAALDKDGVPQSTMMTLAGGKGSTLYLGNVEKGDVSFEPNIGDAGLPCQPCDGPKLPTQAGVVTWYDFECGTATDCL